MSLCNMAVSISYTTYGEANIRDALIIPALKEAVLYKRSVGFFSTSVFDTILPGILSLARRRGKIQIIASPHLSENDIEAIELGYSARNAVYTNAFLHDFEEAVSALNDEKLRMAVDLIVSGILDIRIVDFEANRSNGASAGDYHDKLGIISDEMGDSIVFVGSPNETENGYRRNYEKVRVFKSWDSVQDMYVEDEIREFDLLWDGQNPYLKTYTFHEALVQSILKINKQREQQRANSSPIKLRDYQQDAIKAWVNNHYHGFFVMATGTGKTWTAIFAATELVKVEPCMVVIAAPYKHLVQQWAEDVKKCFRDATIIMVSSENHYWSNQLSDAIVEQRLNPKNQIIVITTITSFNLERFEKTIAKSRQKKLLIVDEAHRFTQLNESLKKRYPYMLGLSATPFSGKNTAKGNALMAFFGGQVFNLPIEVAMERGFLVGYNYYPIYVHATEQEEALFRQKSLQIAACFKNGICIDPDNLVKLLRARLRILSMAQEKIDGIDALIRHIQESHHFIVYCGDGHLFDAGTDEIRHIQYVKRHLSEFGFKASQFTASETMSERMQLIDAFNNGEIDVLAAIRCLDEGINIPSIHGALILSSNDDYREFVQRRGRILRLFEGKKYANIYDVIVLASHQTPKIAEIEFRRFYEYARLARNSDDLLVELENISAEYGMTIEDYALSFDDEMEDTLDE